LERGGKLALIVLGEKDKKRKRQDASGPDHGFITVRSPPKAEKGREKGGQTVRGEKGGHCWGENVQHSSWEIEAF